MSEHRDVAEREGGQQLGGTEQARAANHGVRSLVRAARSFLFYDAHNEAVTRFLEELRLAFDDYCHRFGDLDLSIAADAIRLGKEGEVIYREADRERSLAFRLYRDGVRRLLIRGRVEWEDLVALLEVLSVRYTGLRQQEDDMVTLLRRADFEAIEITAVQGFVSDDEEQPGDPARSDELILEQALARVVVPRDFDLPPTRLGKRKKVSFVPVPAELKARAAAEASARRVTLDCLSLVALTLTQAQAEPPGGLAIPDALDLIEEIRDFLLTEGEVRGLVELRNLVTQVPAGLPGQPELARLVSEYGDAGSISRLVRSVPPEQEQLPAVLHELLASLPGDVPQVLMDLMHAEHSAHLRRVLRQALEPWVADRQAELMQRIRTDPGHGGADLLRALSQGAPEAARRLVVELAIVAAPDIQVECIHIIGRSSQGSTARNLLLKLFDDPSSQVRQTAGRTLGGFKDNASFQSVRALVERRAASGFSDDLAQVLGETLAAIDPRRALELFTEWVRPRGRLRLSKAGEDQLPWVALPGLAALDADRVDEILKTFAERQGGDLGRAATRARVARARRLSDPASP